MKSINSSEQHNNSIIVTKFVRTGICRTFVILLIGNCFSFDWRLFFKNVITGDRFFLTSHFILSSFITFHCGFFLFEFFYSKYCFLSLFVVYLQIDCVFYNNLTAWHRMTQHLLLFRRIYIEWNIFLLLLIDCGVLFCLVSIKTRDWQF